MWRDSAGLILRVDDARGTRIFTYDDCGRLVRVRGLRERLPCEAKVPATLPGEYWEHQFHYGRLGVVREVDCIGRTHTLKGTPPIDPLKGTTLKEHRHGGATPPKARGGATRVFEFDPAGRLEEAHEKDRPRAVRDREGP